MKNLLLLLLMSFMFTAAFAQKSPEEKARKTTEKLTSSLALDEAQQTEIEALYVSHYTQLQESKKDKAARKEIKANLEAQMENILTPEQFEKYALKKEKKVKKRKKRKAKNKRMAKMDRKLSKTYTPEEATMAAQKARDRMTEQLTLDKTQSAQIMDIYNSFYQELTAINMQEGKTDDELREERKTLSKSMKEKVDAVLTEEQKARRKELKKSKKQRRNEKK